MLEEHLLAELEARDLPKLNLALFTVLAMRLRWGDFVEAIKHADRATLVAAQLGVPPVQYPTFRAIGLLGLGRYAEAWASLQREIVDDEHPFGRLVRDLGVGLLRAELFDNAGAVDLLTDVANRGRELRRIWIEDWAEAVKAVALARLGRLEEVDWGRFDRPEWPASTRAVPSSPGACAASVSMPATCTMPASCWRSPTARWWRRST